MVDRLIFVHQVMPVQMLAWVIMPEHVHLLVRPTGHRVEIQDYLKKLKTRFARQMLDRWRDHDASILGRLQDQSGRSHFWQAGGGYDRNIVSEDEFIEKLNYIHANPIKRKLVTSPEQWRWSSARHYLGLSCVGPAIDPVRCD